MLQPKATIDSNQLNAIIDAATEGRHITMRCLSGEMLNGTILSIHLTPSGASLNVLSDGVSTIVTLRIVKEEKQSQRKTLRTPLLKAERF